MQWHSGACSTAAAAANHHHINPDFQPNGGYWRGPTWLDQAYFAVAGLHNYGYHECLHGNIQINTQCRRRSK